MNKMNSIKAIKQYRADLRGQSGSGNKSKSWLNSHTVYDKNGNILLQETFYPNGSVNEIIANDYDANGRLIQEKCQFGDEDHIEKRNFYRNEEGVIVREIKYFAEDTFDTITYHYNDQQQLVSKKTINDEQETEEETRFEYMNGLLLRAATFDGDGELLKEENFEWDDAGRQTTVKTVNTLTGEDFAIRTTYDQSGRKLSETREDDEGNPVQQLFYTYTDQGNLLSILTEENGKNAVMVYEYDASGNLIKQEETDEAGNVLILVKREFDEHNNPLSTEVFIDGQGLSPSSHYVTRFEYEFFEN